MRRPGGPLLLALILPAVVGVAVAGVGLHARPTATPAGSTTPQGSSTPASISALTPPARSNAAFTWDGARHVDLLVGGFGAQGSLDDTWAWDGQQWHQLHPAASPPPMTGQAAAYDPGTQRVMLVGRVQPPSPQQAMSGPDLETWSWDGGTWHRESAATLPIESILGPVMLAFDAHAHRMLLAGPGRADMLRGSLGVPQPPSSQPLRTYAWSGGRWQLVDDSVEVPATSLAMAWDSATNQVRLVAASAQPVAPCGRPGQPTPSAVPSGVTCAADGAYTFTCNPTTCPNGRQWTWNGSTWTPGKATPYLGSLGAGSLVTNPIGPGLSHTNGASLWSWDGSAWSNRPAGSRQSLIAAAVAGDPDRHTLVVFGGRVLDRASPSRTSISSQTFTWDGTRWSGRGGAVTDLPPPSPAPAGLTPPSCNVLPASQPPTTVTSTLQGSTLRIDVSLPQPVTASNAAGSCAAGHSVDYALTDGGGHPLEVQGSPTRDKTMASHETLDWTNWCGSAAVYLSVQVSNGTTGLTLMRTVPPCTDRAQPSLLRLLPAASS